jgi:4-amino-4-deoxy-L-arabinose transferase-like glycosyltransferase
MNKKFKFSLLLVILVIGLALRLWQLGAVPISPDWDEVALGYDAYSIMHTGRDEFGAFMPVVLRSFDDYKPALYAYLAIPTVAVLGLTTYAVRLPSVAMGIVGILAMYFLVKELFTVPKSKDNSSTSFGQNYAEILALIAAFLLTISPWQIQFSRTAFETNTGLTFNLLVALFFLKGLKKPWLLSLATLFAGLDLMVYQSERVFTPLLFLSLVIIYRKELFAVSKKYLAAAVIVGIVAVLPTLVYIVGNPNSLQRAEGTSLLSDKSQLLSNNYIRLKDDKDNNDKIGSLIDNRRVIYTKQVIAGYLVHFDPNWLFFEGDNARHHAPGMGLLYLLDLPFLLFGIYFFLFGKFDKKTKYVVFSWLLLAPIPAAVTIDVPHAVRTMNMLPMLLILIAIGWFVGYQLLFKNQESRIKNKGLRIVVVCIILFLALFNFAYYLNQYFVQQNYFNAPDWQYGYQQAVSQVERLQGQYQTIVVSDKTPMDESYMFFLFYLKYPPQQYQQLVAEGKNLSYDNHQFGKYQFRPFNWTTENHKKSTLYIGSVSDFPSHINAKEIISNPDGSPAILFVDPKNN